jgi:sulfate adenylyltransferase
VAGGDRPGDAVLVNAIIGTKRLGDFVDEAILEGREALGLGGYFARVSFVLWDMRYGGPLESVDYSYGRYASHVWGVAARIWTISSTPTPSMCCGRGVSRATALMGLLTRWKGDLGLGLFCWGEFAYCPKCGGWAFLGGLGEGSLCGHVVEGFLALFCGGSLGGPSVAFCGYAT